MSRAARLPQVPTHHGRYRIIGCSLWDGTGEGILDDAELIVDDGRIEYAGSRRADLEWHTAPTIDLDGAYVLPGFIDTHVHLRIPHEEAPQALLARFASHMSLRAATTIKDTLNAGITTARDLGGLDAGYRNAIAEGTIDGPRLHLAVSVISPTGGHVDMHLPNGARVGREDASIAKIADTDDEIRRAVRELIRSEADVIKICTTGGVSSPSDTPHDLGVSEHQVRIILEETARRAGAAGRRARPRYPGHPRSGPRRCSQR